MIFTNILIAIALGLFTFAVSIVVYELVLLNTAFGDDTESDLGWCARGDTRFCDKIDIEQLQDQILNRTVEWNNLHGN